MKQKIIRGEAVTWQQFAIFLTCLLAALAGIASGLYLYIGSEIRGLDNRLRNLESDVSGIRSFLYTQRAKAAGISAPRIDYVAARPEATFTGIYEFEGDDSTGHHKMELEVNYHILKLTADSVAFRLEWVMRDNGKVTYRSIDPIQVIPITRPVTLRFNVTDDQGKPKIILPPMTIVLVDRRPGELIVASGFQLSEAVKRS